MTTLGPALPLLLAGLTLPLRAEPPLLASAPEPDRAGLIGSVVRSRRWNLRQNPTPVEELEGDVVYKAPGRMLRADWALFDHASQDISARGDLRAEQALRDGNLVLLAAQHGTHNRKAGLGQVQGRSAEDPVRFYLRAGADGPQIGEGQARRLRWDLRQKTVTAEGDLLFTQLRGQARAETAVYEHEHGSLSLYGRRPVLTARGDDRSGAHWAAAVQAERITAWQLAPDRVRVVARGGTQGWLHFPSRQGRIPGRR